jgi:hypothetical protein
MRETIAVKYFSRYDNLVSGNDLYAVSDKKHRLSATIIPYCDGSLLGLVDSEIKLFVFR